MPSSHFYQPAHKNLKILFVIRSSEHYYYFASIVKELARKKHKVSVFFDKYCSSKSLAHIEKIKGVNYAWAQKEMSKLSKFIYHLHDLLSYGRYLRVKSQSAFYSERWKKYYLFAPFRFLVNLPFFESILLPRVLSIIKKIIMVAPVDEKILTDLKSSSPDIVVCTPCNMPFLSADKEYLRAAKLLKIPTVLPVFSWDNLTTKGLIFPQPDVLLAWNKIQVEESVAHHEIPEKSVRITGASLFDFWFKIQRPSISRQDFCRKFDLSERDPILLYIETSDSLTGDERWVVTKLINWLKRSNNQKISSVQIVVRPHPFKTHFKGFSEERIVIVPKNSTWPEEESAAQLYYDCLYYSFGVCGINTTGFIDAAILYRPTVGILFDKYKRTQSETVHFRQLVDNKVIDLARNRKDFLDFCTKAVNGKDKHELARKLFVKNFIRPRGLNKPAGKWGAEEIEKLAQDNI